MRRIGPAAATATGDLVTVKALRECETNAPEKAYTVESAGPATGKLGRAASCAAWSATAKAHSDDAVMPALLGLVRQGDRRPALGYEINRPGPSLS